MKKKKINELLGSMSRSKLRYRLHRFKNKRNEPHEEIDQAIDEHFTQQDAFDGWERFTETWDVAVDEPMNAVKRRFSMDEEWDIILKYRVK